MHTAMHTMTVCSPDLLELVLDYAEDPALFAILVSVADHDALRTKLKNFVSGDGDSFYFKVINVLNYEYTACILDDQAWNWIRLIFAKCICFLRSCPLPYLSALHMKFWEHDFLDYLLSEPPGPDIVSRILSNAVHFSWSAHDVEQKILQNSKFVSLSPTQKLRRLTPIIQGFACRHEWDLAFPLLQYYRSIENQDSVPSSCPRILGDTAATCTHRDVHAAGDNHHTRPSTSLSDSGHIQLNQHHQNYATASNPFSIPAPAVSSQWGNNILTTHSGHFSTHRPPFFTRFLPLVVALAIHHLKSPAAQYNTGQQHSTIMRRMQSLSLQQTPPATTNTSPNHIHPRWSGMSPDLLPLLSARCFPHASPSDTAVLTLWRSIVVFPRTWLGDHLERGERNEVNGCIDERIDEFLVSLNGNCVDHAVVTLSSLLITDGRLSALIRLSLAYPTCATSQFCVLLAIKYRRLAVARWLLATQFPSVALKRIKFAPDAILSCLSPDIVNFCLSKDLIKLSTPTFSTSCLHFVEKVFLEPPQHPPLPSPLSPPVSPPNWETSWRSVVRRIRLPDLVKNTYLEVLDRIFTVDKKEEVLAAAIEYRSLTVLNWLTDRCMIMREPREIRFTTVMQHSFSILISLFTHYSAPIVSHLEAFWTCRGETLAALLTTSSAACSSSSSRNDSLVANLAVVAARAGQLDALMLLKACHPSLHRDILMEAVAIANEGGWDNVVKWGLCEVEWDSLEGDHQGNLNYASWM